MTHLVKQITCPICPNRDMGTNPPICVKNVRFTRCGYKLGGKYLTKKGFVGRKRMRDHRIVKKDSNKRYYDLVDDIKWLDMELEVKPL